MGRTAKSKPKKKATPKNSDHQNTQGFNAAEIKGAADADTKKEEKLTEKQKADLKFKSVLLMVSAALVLLLVFIPGSSGWRWITGTVWCFRSDMADCIGSGRTIFTAADSGAKTKRTPPKRGWYIFFVWIGHCGSGQQYGAGLVWGGSPNQEPDRCFDCILSRWAG